MWIPGCVRVAIVLGVARPGVVVGIEQGATMLDTPAASGRPAPLACWPLAGPRWLRTTPFSRDPGERRRRLRGDALGGTGGTEVKLALLAVVSPRTLKGFVARTTVAPAPVQVGESGRESKLHTVPEGPSNATMRVSCVRQLSMRVS